MCFFLGGEGEGRGEGEGLDLGRGGVTFGLRGIILSLSVQTLAS